MAKINLAASKQALVVMAHPDDESIWMGGFILKHPELDWTILSLCRASDPDRAPKFAKVCAHLNATGMIEDMDDENNLSYAEMVKTAKKIIAKHLNKSNNKFLYLFTHGKNGEYGHLAHRAIHEAVNELVVEKKLPVGKIYFLNYKKNNHHRTPTMLAKKDSTEFLTLTKQEFTAKKKLVTEIYGFAPNGIDVNLCTNPEAFKIVNNL